MSKNQPFIPTFRGRTLGITVLVAAQYLVGAIHVPFGLWFLAAAPDVYGAYTFVFGLLVAVFAYGLWNGKRWGWIGTVSTSVFVIVADSLTVLNQPSIPGIPKLASVGEIPYSVLVLLYLLQTRVRAKYKISAKTA